MNIAVIGLGYVGCVTAACLARDGHQVIGIDIQASKVDSIREGRSPIIEPGLEDLLKANVDEGRISVSTKISAALENADIVFVCVGTPSKKNGALDLSYVRRVCQEIGEELANIQHYANVVVRSTILPGSSDSLISILEEFSEKKAGKDFGFVVNPEFLREGTAIKDFDEPPFTIIGQIDEQSGKRVGELFSNIDAPIFRVQLGVAEMIKYACNAFHALKVVFANEIGNICKVYGIDSHQVMEIFVQDTKLNLSPDYLKPGFAFGGSCLGKDLRALLHTARNRDVRVPVLESVIPSNQAQIANVVDTIIETGKLDVGIIGLSFKQNTDDLRESPALELAERLIGEGMNVLIYDREVSLSRLHGSNREFIDTVLPHVATHLRDSLVDIVKKADVIVVTKNLSDHEYNALIKALSSDQILIDLVKISNHLRDSFKGIYYGIAW